MDLIKLAGSLKKRESSEHLKLLAKRAAGMYIAKDAKTLTEAVRTSLKGEDLNEDQMRRVVEMANQATWKETFEDNRQVNFEPADANAVVSSFSEEPEVSSPPSLDYQTEPPKAEMPEIDLEKEFGLTESQDYDRLNPKAEAEQEVAKAAAAVDASRHAVDLMKSQMPELADNFFHQVKQAYVFEGHPITKIARAVAAVTDSNFSSSVMKTAAEQLKNQGVRFNLSKEKTASAEEVIINTDHDLLRGAVKLEKIAKSLAQAQSAYSHATLRHKRALASLKGQ